MTPALELRSTDVRYEARRRSASVSALRDATLTVNRGERIAIVGRSGAGKSTIARLATGLVKPTGGTVLSLGADVATATRRELRALRRRIHLVFQDPYQSLHPAFTVRQLVAEPLMISGIRAAERDVQISGALTQVGLTPAEQFLERSPASLSGGQRQRVAIARALVSRPELILADEPTSMLDASLRATIADLLLTLQRADNAALLFITHDLALARYVSDRIVVMANGEIVEDRPTEELLADPGHDETQRLLAAVRHDMSKYPKLETKSSPSGVTRVT